LSSEFALNVKKLFYALMKTSSQGRTPKNFEQWVMRIASSRLKVPNRETSLLDSEPQGTRREQ
jgi:hypothetical protein